MGTVAAAHVGATTHDTQRASTKLTSTYARTSPHRECTRRHTHTHLHTYIRTYTYYTVHTYVHTVLNIALRQLRTVYIHTWTKVPCVSAQDLKSGKGGKCGVSDSKPRDIERVPATAHTPPLWQQYPFSSAPSPPVLQSSLEIDAHEATYTRTHRRKYKKHITT